MTYVIEINQPESCSFEGCKEIATRIIQMSDGSTPNFACSDNEHFGEILMKWGD